MINPNMSPPVLLRRRLSAPETIMRRHFLAQQRSASQENRGSDSAQSWAEDRGSDSNLTRRSDVDSIRKSTLIKRFWESGKPSVLSTPLRSYTDWQHSFGKLRFSGCNEPGQSSIDQLRGNKKSYNSQEDCHLSPKRRISPRHEVQSPKRKMSTMCNGSYGDLSSTTYESPKHNRENVSVHRVKSSALAEEIDDYIIYSSNFSAFSSTESELVTPRRIDKQMTSNTDSAYPNSCSSVTEATSTAKTTDIDLEKRNVIDKILVDHQTTSTNNSKNAVQYQFFVCDNQPTVAQIENINLDKNKNESSTQTNDTTKLNVISNVQLSQSTIDLIFNQIIRDVQRNKIQSSEVTMPNLIHVQNVSNFMIQPETPNKFDETTLEENKTVISQIGSPYKPKDAPSLHRILTSQRSSSLEVNVSSNCSIDKDSDTISLTDSLEDSGNTKESKMTYDEKLVRGELFLLPDNSKPKSATKQPASVFYIPMQNKGSNVTGEQDNKNVSALLPTKLKERLKRRQIEREQKQKETKQKVSRSPDRQQRINSNKQRTPTLPIIENRKQCIEGARARLRKTKTLDVTQGKTTRAVKAFWLPKTTHIHESRHSYKSNESFGGYMRSTSDDNVLNNNNSKCIEILEIMEILEPEQGIHMASSSRSKSKIPILVQQHQQQLQNQQHRLPKLEKELSRSSIKNHMPQYLSIDSISNPCDPKLDQLVANILIDTLNRDGEISANEIRRRNKPHDGDKRRHQLSSRSGKSKSGQFEVIPEEKPRHNVVKTTMELNNNPQLIDSAAEILTKHILETDLDSDIKNSEQKEDENSHKEKGKFPNGWITFYMLQKNNSPDSTSDEGSHKMAINLGKCETYFHKNCIFFPKELFNDSNYKTEDQCDTDNDTVYSRKDKIRKMHDSHRPQETVSDVNVSKSEPRDITLDTADMGSSTSLLSRQWGGWSVTVSGTGDPSVGSIPDVEMKLKFPTGRSRLAPSRNLPPLNATTLNASSSHHGHTNTSDAFTFRDIDPLNVRDVRMKNSASYSSSAIPSKLEPRDTKTSMQRKILNRPNRLVPGLSSDRPYGHLFDKIPNIVTISKCASKRDTLSERDVKQLFQQSP